MTADRRLRVAAIGAGYFSQFHHEAWQRLPEAELVGLQDLDAGAGRRRAEQLGIPAYATLEEMLDKARPDLVDIATPPPSHFELISRIAERRLPMICQKAFCRSLEEAEAAVGVAEKAGTLLVVHENFRFQPWYAELKRLIGEGAIGEVYQLAFKLRPGDGQGPSAYLDRQPYFRTMERFLVHETAVHWIDAFRYLLGEPIAVSANLRRLNAGILGEDAGHILFEYASGARALFDGNRLADHRAANRRLTMGEFLAEGSAGALRLDGFGRIFHRAFGSNDEREIAYAWSDRGFGGDCVYRLQDHVVRHLKGQGPIANAGRDYLPVLYAERAIYQAHEQGRRVMLDAGRIGDHIRKP
jgi:predicted dehydrogenase